jgi:hypothetical protein
MRNLMTAAAVLLIGSAAYAQTPSSTPGGNAPTGTTPPVQAQPQPQTQQSTAKITQQIRTNLQQAGFSDIKMMPSSFLVRAKDKDGNPVMMVINPDSVTAVTEVDQGKTGSTTGQALGASKTSPSGSTSNKK